jgi:hypothetical protein
MGMLQIYIPANFINRTWTMATHPESSSWYACTDTCLGVTHIGNSGAAMTANLWVSCGPPPTYEHVYLPLVLKRHGGILNGDSDVASIRVHGSIVVASASRARC